MAVKKFVFQTYGIITVLFTFSDNSEFRNTYKNVVYRQFYDVS